MTYDHAPTAALATAISTAYLTPGRTASIGTGQFARAVINALNNLGYTLTPTGQPQATREPPNTHLLTPQEAADLYRVSTYTVAYWADQGYITCVRTPGGGRRYLRSEITQWLAAADGNVHVLPPEPDPLAPPPDVAVVLDAPDV